MSGCGARWTPRAPGSKAGGKSTSRPQNFFVCYFSPPIGSCSPPSFRWVALPMGRPSRSVALPMGRSSDGSPFRWVALSASQPGPSEREAENASRPPLPCAAPRRTALAGSHHSPWWGSETSRRRGEKVGRSAGVRDQYWTSLWADKPGRPGRNRGRSHAVGRQELLRRVHKLSMVSCGLIRASLYLLVVLCDFSACHLCF